MLTDTQVTQFRRDGFLKGGRVLSDAQVEVLREELGRVIAGHDKGGPQPVLLRNLTGKDGSPVWQIVNIWQASDAFNDLVHNQTVAEEVAQLAGANELRVWHDQIQYKPAGIGGVNAWHQDWPYWPILDRPTQVTAWVALDDVDESNGCMSMVPGSHLWGNQVQFLHTITDFKAMPARFDGHDLQVRLCPVGKGEVHYHHGLTWHGSQANTSGRPRRALAIHLMTEQNRYVASGTHVMKQFVEVADGEPLRGQHFPLVWSRSQEEPARPRERQAVAVE
jgi:phytanoyl-CoA hydroxylase